MLRQLFREAGVGGVQTLTACTSFVVDGSTFSASCPLSYRRLHNSTLRPLPPSSLPPPSLLPLSLLPEPADAE